MRIKSKYKIARRLGAAVFEKAQTQKFAARNEGGKSFKGGRGGKSGHGLTEFGKAVLEKQKARFTYLINERQFKNYAAAAIAEHKKKPEDNFYQSLEMRLDNVVSRLGLAPTRLAARQMVGHGHISVNGKRVTIPSYQVSVGEQISVMPRSCKSKLFADILERAKEYNVPNWLFFDPIKLEGKVISLPELSPAELHFDIAAILDFYKR
jgi:small subunit ribosomal protein S4